MNITKLALALGVHAEPAATVATVPSAFDEPPGSSGMEAPAEAGALVRAP